MTILRSAAPVVVGVCLFVAPGCGGSDKGSQVNGGSAASGGASALGAAASGGASTTGVGSTGSGSTGSGANGSGSGGSLNLVIDGSAGDRGTGTAAGGSPEVCDGVDNDNDGSIDNVDKNGDGVCDCLLIATLGVKGTSGQGDVFATRLSARSDVGAVDLADQELTPELLAKYEVIVAQNVKNNHQYSASEVAALSAWVENGGGFMTLIGYSSSGEAHNVNRLLAPFGMSYTDEQILKKSGNSTVPITDWTPHPVDNGVTSVGVDNGYPVLGKGLTIATGGGYDVGKAQEVGKGHVFLWGDEWITYNSEWQDHPEYQVQGLWLNAIKWLTVRTRCQVTIPENPR